MVPRRKFCDKRDPCFSRCNHISRVKPPRIFCIPGTYLELASHLETFGEEFYQYTALLSRYFSCYIPGIFPDRSPLPSPGFLNGRALSRIFCIPGTYLELASHLEQRLGRIGFRYFSIFFFIKLCKKYFINS
jgi:hypothetical protein